MITIIKAGFQIFRRFQILLYYKTQAKSYKQQDFKGVMMQDTEMTYKRKVLIVTLKVKIADSEECFYLSEQLQIRMHLERKIMPEAIRKHTKLRNKLLKARAEENRKRQLSLTTKLLCFSFTKIQKRVLWQSQ